MDAQPQNEMLAFWEPHLPKQRDMGSKEERDQSQDPQLPG